MQTSYEGTAPATKGTFQLMYVDVYNQIFNFFLKKALPSE